MNSFPKTGKKVEMSSLIRLENIFEKVMIRWDKSKSLLFYLIFFNDAVFLLTVYPRENT